MERSLAELAAHVGGTVEGDGRLRILGLASLEEAGPGELSFYGNPRYRKELGTTRASAVLLPPGEPVTRTDVAWVRVASPHLAFARLLALFHPGAAARRRACIPGPRCTPRRRLDPSATVMALAVVEAGAVVGARLGAVAGELPRRGRPARRGLRAPAGGHRPRALRARDRVVLQPGVVVGSDGFGFAFDPAGPAHVKVPQVGIVRIEDDVEVGAGSCIDRATTGETVIGRGTKIDNLVQIAHNVRVGPLSILCAQVGISGSTELGTGVVLAGQVGIVGHVRVGDGARVAAQSGVPHDVPAGRDLLRIPRGGARPLAAPVRGAEAAPGAAARGETAARPGGCARVEEGRVRTMMDVQEIQKLLPHRYPFLLVDRVVSIEPGKTLRAYKNVSVNEPFFDGHFPGHPVMPGVLVLEALAQASAILCYRSTGFDPSQKVTYLMAIDGAKFRKPTVPGDRLDLEVEVLRLKGAVVKTRGVAKVDGEVVAEGEFLATVVDKDR